MPVIRLVDSDGFGITIFEHDGVPEKTVQELQQLIDDPTGAVGLDEIRESLLENGWYEMSDGRSNGDNTEFVFTRDDFKEE